MKTTWTFGQKIGVAFAAIVGLALVIAVVAIGTLRSAVSVKDRVITEHAEDRIRIEHLRDVVDRRISASRGYLLTGEDVYLAEIKGYRDEFTKSMADLTATLEGGPEGQQLLATVRATEAEYMKSAEQVYALRKQGAPTAKVVEAWDATAKPASTALVKALDDLAARKTAVFKAARDDSNRSASRASTFLGVLGVLALLLTVLLSIVLTKALTKQVGAAIQHLQTSSTQLQASASQQATTAKEQSAATNDINTTTRELLASSRQIAESAQRVLRIAEETTGAARGGDEKLLRAREGLQGILSQVEAIVAHTLDLGRKSQQIGLILEIIDELAEQTNILAINATIEAAGAGSSGRRFAVVAEEIRRLADRVGGSTREIRTLIDEIRAAANTTAMATEQGAKAADAGLKQFKEVTAAFSEIVTQVENATEVAREIDLSTRQQSTAVEQVSSAMADVAQSATEVESTSRQTVQIASELASLSKELGRIVRSDQHPA